MDNKYRKIDNYINLVPYYDNFEVALKWYEDLELCKMVDNIDEIYNINRLKRMYTYLNNNGLCYYIQYKNKLVGDITLKYNGEISIVICKEYQNMGIGVKCIKNILALARELGKNKVLANIYSFNSQSQKLFTSLGFKKFKNEWYSFTFEAQEQYDLQ